MWLEGVCGRVCFGHPLTLSDHSRTALLFRWGVRDQRGSSTSTVRAGDFKFLATHSQEENGSQSGKEKCRKEGGTLWPCWAGRLEVRWELGGRQGRGRKIRPWRTGLWDSLSSVKANLSLRLEPGSALTHLHRSHWARSVLCPWLWDSVGTEAQALTGAEHTGPLCGVSPLLPHSSPLSLPLTSLPDFPWGKSQQDSSHSRCNQTGPGSGRLGGSQPAPMVRNSCLRVCVQPLCPDCFISPRAPTLPPLGVRLSSRLRLKEELDWGDGEWPGAWYSSELCTLSVPWCSTELGAGRVLSTASQMVLWIPQSVRGWVGILEEFGRSGHIASHRSCLRMLLLLGLLL